MLQSKQRLLELNSKLAETLTSKGVEATAYGTTTALINKVAEITSGDDTFLKSVIDGSITSLSIPDDVNVAKINNYGFSQSLLETVIINSKDLVIGEYAFCKCYSLKSVICHAKEIKVQAFTWSPIEVMDLRCEVYEANLTNSTNLKTVYLGAEAKSIKGKMFNSTSNLEFVTLGDGFNANNLYLSASTLYSRETIVSWLNALANRTGLIAYTLTIGDINLNKLTDEDVSIASKKNWIII